MTRGKIPTPAYHLVDFRRYVELNPRRLLDFEAGQRGCIFECAFCYSPTHWGRGERTQAIPVFREQLSLAKQAGGQSFFFVQDNFCNNPKRTIALCKEFAPENIKFHCYATIAQIDNPVVAALAAAGCHAVYIGIDAVHPKARRKFTKNLYHGQEHMVEKIQCLQSYGVQPNLAFMLEEPDQDRAVLEATIAAAALARLHGCPIRLNTLTLYPGTTAFAHHTAEFYPDPFKARFTMDVPPILQENPFALESPNLFPFHGSHRAPAHQGYFQFGVNALFSLINLFPEVIYRLAEKGRAWDIVDNVISKRDPFEEATLSTKVRVFRHIERFQEMVKMVRGSQAYDHFEAQWNEDSASGI